MKTHIFHLQIVPVSDILPHEYYDTKRAAPLIAKIKKEGHLSNPILVANFENNKYLQLDGMNRLSIFKIMKIPTILTQIVDYNNQEEVELSSWIHLFSADNNKYLSYLKKMGFSIKPGTIAEVGHRYVKEEGRGRLCTVITKDKKVFLVSVNGNLHSKILLLNKVVNYYKSKIIRDVLPQHVDFNDIEILFSSHTDTNMIIVFPTFTRHQIIDVVKQGGVFPPGITRHIIKRRCLNVNIPLSFFSTNISSDHHNKALEKRLLTRGFRVYEEATIYFE